MELNYLSIDIGGTNIKYALINHKGKFIFKDKISTPKEKAAFLASIDQIVNKYQTKIAGLAICAPGKIEETTIRFGGALPFLDGIDFAEIYSQLQLPIAVINDGKAAVLAENWLGNLKGEKNCAAIILGTGVGGGIMLNGQLLNGSHFQAGELSYMILNSSQAAVPGQLLGKNFVGGLLSAVALIKQINQLAGNTDLTDGLAAFETLATTTNQQIKQLFSTYCHNVACLIMNIQSVIDLDKFVIGGGISSQELVISGIRSSYDQLYKENKLVELTLTKPKIEVAKFNNDANLYGALYKLLND